MMKKAIALILITLVIMVLPVLSSAKMSSLLYHGADAVSDASHHDHKHDDATHNEGHQCCHAHGQICPLLAHSDQAPEFSLREQHGTEYRFVVTTTSISPEFRPPTV